MGVHEALFARAAGAAALTALIGTNPTRFFPGTAPQKPDKPYVVFGRVGEPPDHLSGADSALKPARFQFTCYDDESDDARALASQVVAAFDRLAGTFASVVIQCIFIENRVDDQWDDDVKLCASIVDAIVWHEGS